MKKLSTLIAVAALSASAHSADISASYVRDMNLDKNGVRVQASAGGMLGFTPTASVTHINDVYTRYAAGVSYELVKAGDLTLSLASSGVYQNSVGAEDGYGMTVGAQAELAVTKAVSVVAGVERFLGQSRVQPFVGNQATLGLAVKF